MDGVLLRHRNLQFTFGENLGIIIPSEVPVYLHDRYIPGASPRTKPIRGIKEKYGFRAVYR